MNEKRQANRLPPPAFPPGQRRHQPHRNSNHHPEVAPETDVEAGDPIISPDEPLPLRRDPIEQAFISPDDPMPERGGEQGSEFADYVAPSQDEDEGEMVGMDMDAHATPLELMTAVDPFVAEVVDAIVRLGEDLRRKGEAGLRTTPGMSRFDATLRAYCVGYLAGRRAEDPPPPVESEDW